MGLLLPFACYIQKQYGKKQRISLGLKLGSVSRRQEEFIQKSKSAASNIGEIGTTLIANTGVCLHRGSLTTKGERRVLLLHYCSSMDYLPRQDKKGHKGLGITVEHLSEGEKQKLVKQFGRWC